jgi:hypothetical protein
MSQIRTGKTGTSPLTYGGRVFTLRSMRQHQTAEGQLHTLALLEQLRDASKDLWGASSEAYFRVDELLRQLANPNLHDIPRNLPFRVEMWDCDDQHIRWVIAASASVVRRSQIIRINGSRCGMGRWLYDSIHEPNQSCPLRGSGLCSAATGTVGCTGPLIGPSQHSSIA